MKQALTSKELKLMGFKLCSHLILADQKHPLGKPCVDSEGRLYLLTRSSGLISVERLISEIEIASKECYEKKTA